MFFLERAPNSPLFKMHLSDSPLNLPRPEIPRRFCHVLVPPVPGADSANEKSRSLAPLCAYITGESDEGWLRFGYLLQKRFVCRPGTGDSQRRPLSLGY